MRRAAWMAVTQVIAFGLAMSSSMVAQQPELKGGPGGSSNVIQPSQGSLTGEVLFTRVVEHNLKREANLKYYSVSRHYCVQDKNDKVRAELDAVVEFQAPGPKQFKVISQRGSSIVRRLVFGGLLDSETDASKGQSHRDSSITPANYVFEVVGEEVVDGHHCLVAKATPLRKDKYLFEGNVWVHATDFAIVKIVGKPAKNPSFWVKKVEFVRRYQKIGDFWMPLQDLSVSQVRIVGKGTLTIDHRNYQIHAIDGTKLPASEKRLKPVPPVAEIVRPGLQGETAPSCPSFLAGC
jgi:hypothetical protein